MLYEKITSKIIQSAYKVYHTLGNGYLEVLYERAMLIECKKRNLSTKNQEKVNVFYENYLIGEYFVDLLVENKIIIELKAVHQINKMHCAQLIHYLSATNFNLGLLINFGADELFVKRIKL